MSLWFILRCFGPVYRMPVQKRSKLTWSQKPTSHHNNRSSCSNRSNPGLSTIAVIQSTTFLGKLNPLNGLAASLLTCHVTIDFFSILLLFFFLLSAFLRLRLFFSWKVWLAILPGRKTYIPCVPTRPPGLRYLVLAGVLIRPPHISWSHHLYT